MIPTGGLRTAVKPVVLTTGPPDQEDESGVDPPVVVTVIEVFGVTLQYCVIPVVPVATTGIAKSTLFVDVYTQPPLSVTVTV